MSFHVGQLVVCVDDKRTPGFTLDGLRRGQIYTVRETGIVSALSGTPNCIRLLEIVRGPCPNNGWPDLPYLARRFRPVDENRISVFRKIAASPRERIRIGEDA